MTYSLQNCGCGCNQSVTPNIPATNDKCRASLESTSIGALVWLQGLDVNLCERFQRLSDVIGLRDCVGTRISIDTPIVTCADFRNQLCNALTQLASGGIANSQTLLVGADCKTYTLPATTPGVETPNTAIDTSTIDMSATGTLGRTISGNVKVSDDAGQLIEIRSDGLYASFDAPSVPTACQQIQAFDAAGDVISGTILVGADCRKYTYNPPTPPGFTITDTASIDLLLTGTNLSAGIRLDPNFIGRVTADGLELTCADVLACAPAVTVIDTTTLDLSITGQQLQGDVKVSIVPGNNIEIKPDGLYVSVCAALDDGPVATPAIPGVTELVGADCNRYTLPTGTNLTVTDTTTVNHTLTGNNLQSSVIVSPSTLISVGPFGLQVLCEDVQDCVFNIANNFWSYNDLGNQVLFNPSADSGNQITNGSDGRPFVPPATDQITVTDTSCINLTITDGNISAVPIISPQAGNILTCENDGLYATTTVDVNITAQDTNCIDIGVTEATPNNFVITAVPVISSDVGNSLQCRVTGLYAAASGLVVASDTDCINMTSVEGPSGTFTVSAQPTISPAAGNKLICTPTGLYSSGATVQALDSQCIDVTVTEGPADTYTVSASPILANTYPGYPAGCNGLVCTPTGLAAPPDSACMTDLILGSNNYSGATIEGQTGGGLPVTINIINPSNCRDAVLKITNSIPEQNQGNTTSPGDTVVQFTTVHQFNLPGVQVTGPITLTTWKTVSSTSVGPDTSSKDITFDFIVPPSFVGSYTSFTTFVQQDGSLDSLVIAPTVLHYDLVTC